MLGTYERLGVHVLASNITVLRALRRKLNRKAFTRENRTRRHMLYRDILAIHKAAGDLFMHYRL